MKKAHKADRYLMTWEQLLAIRRVLMGRNIYFQAGHSSIFVPSQRAKYILSHNQAGIPIAREWPDTDGEIIWMTPGEAARTELERNFPDVKKIGWPKKSVKLFDFRWPMYFTGKWKGEAVYIDLVGAYWQIYRYLMLDCCFPRGLGQLHLWPVAERLKDWKPARNSVIGICRSRQSVGFRGGTRYTLKPFNQFLSPHLWATVMGVLNEVAYKAIDYGGIYVNTDGYILPTYSRAVEFGQFLTDFGLEHRAMAGDCVIRGWGNYRVAGRETKSFSVSQEWNGRTFKSLDLPDNNNPLKLLNWWNKECKTWTQKKFINS